MEIDSKKEWQSFLRQETFRISSVMVTSVFFFPKFIELLNYTKINIFTVCKLYLRECLPKTFFKTCLLKIFPFSL